MERLLKYGAYDIFTEEKTEDGGGALASELFFQEDIDTIMQNNSVTVTYNPAASAKTALEMTEEEGEETAEREEERGSPARKRRKEDAKKEEENREGKRKDVIAPRAPSSFSKACFVSQVDGNDIDVDAPDFWTRMIGT